MQKHDINMIKDNLDNYKMILMKFKFRILRYKLYLNNKS